MDSIKAVVQKVIPRGKHGPFAVATSDGIAGSVTFSLEPTVWQEEDWPEEGTMVHLGALREKRAGWRAKTGRFWRPSDEQTQQTERSRGVIEFLYPSVRQFPFDEACEQIVRELERRNWQVPGLSVEFRVYGSGDQKFRMVSSIRGHDFKLSFGRIQRTLQGGRWNDTAAVTDLVIPKKALQVYHDESGPTLYLYVGSNYERDRDRFTDGLKVNSKLRGEPKTYLMYKGECRCGGGFLGAGDRTPHTHPNRRPPLLAHSNDLGREYDPVGLQPRRFKTADVMAEFRRYLERVVLPMVVSQPIPEEAVDAFAEPEPTPFSSEVGPLFCFCEYRDAERIIRGKADPASLAPASRYGLAGGGYRLMSLGTPNDDTVPEVAYDGFLWCGIGEVTSATAIESLEVPGHYRWADREKFAVRIEPNRADGIYIADHGQYERRRRELAASLAGRDQFTDDEVADFTRARARTIVSIAEYRGGYERPVVLINRELGFDEVQVLCGPIVEVSAMEVNVE